MAKLSEKGHLAAGAVNILREARAFIAPPERWIQSEFYMGGGACAIGALGVTQGIRHRNGDLHTSAIDGNKHARRAALALAAAIGQGNEVEREASPMTVWASDIFRFNDAPRTSHSDVLAAFDLAIEQQCKIVQQEAMEDSDGADSQ